MDALKPLLPVGDRAGGDPRRTRLLRRGRAAPGRAGLRRRDRGARAPRGGRRVRGQRGVRGRHVLLGHGRDCVPQASDGWVGILPADCCLVRPETVGRLARAMSEPAADVVYPVAAGARGHPPLLRPASATAGAGRGPGVDPAGGPRRRGGRGGRGSRSTTVLSCSTWTTGGSTSASSSWPETKACPMTTSATRCTGARARRSRCASTPPWSPSWRPPSGARSSRRART